MAKLNFKSEPGDDFNGIPDPANDNNPDFVPASKLPDFLKSDAKLADFTNPGGLIEEMIDWIVASAEQPSRELALSAVLPFLASLIGRRYSTTMRDTRANMYVIALAPSGFGKDHARGQLKRLRTAAEGWLDKFYGPERIMSASALRNALIEHPSKICLIDEFGGFVRDITDRKSPGHQRAISTDLRDMWSASGSLFGGAEYAATKAVTIHNPNLNVYGTATPGQFWSAMRNASAEDGLLPRFLLFSLERASASELVVPGISVSDVPKAIVERIISLAGINRTVDDKPKLGEVLERVAKVGGKSPLPPTVVGWTDDALEAMFEFKKGEVDAARTATELAAPFVGRANEYAIKLALILAVTGVNPINRDRPRGWKGLRWSKPIVDIEKWNWATGLVRRCISDMVTAVDRFVAENEKEALVKAIRLAIEKAGAKGITEGGVIRAIPDGHQSRMRFEILADLQTTGEVEVVDKEASAKGGRPSRRYFWRG